MVERCQRGDPAAWQELIEHYRRLVYSVPRRAGLSRDACDDVFQEVFAILHAKIAMIERASGLPKWLATTARRVTLRRREADARAARVEVRVDVSDAAGSTGRAMETPEAILGRWERISAVRSAVERLGPPCTALLEAIALAGERPDYGVLAERLGMPLGSLGPTRARCLSKLLAQLRLVELLPEGHDPP